MLVSPCDNGTHKAQKTSIARTLADKTSDPAYVANMQGVAVHAGEHMDDENDLTVLLTARSARNFGKLISEMVDS